MINVICDERSWDDLLRTVPIKERFSEVGEYDPRLIEMCGRPMLAVFGNLRVHIYPPPTITSTDSELLDSLESYIKENGYVLLHDLTGSDDPKWPEGYRGGGIGLLSWANNRGLREALKATTHRNNGETRKA